MTQYHGFMNKVFLFDLDGTITRDELLPLIGEKIGLFDELNELTKATMQGEIPFDQSFLRRVEMLNKIKLSDIQDIILEASCFENLLGWIKAHREISFITTGNLDIWIQPWLERHNLNGFASKAKVVGNGYIVEKILKKETVLQKFAGLESVMVGDGANDARLMELCDTAIATELTHKVAPILWEHANYIINDEDKLCRLLTQLL